MKSYLDYNATAPLKPELRRAMEGVWELPCNPSSVHGYGRHAKKLLEDARREVAESVSAFGNEVIFTATGTEANNMALRGSGRKKIYVSAIEHASVLKAVEEAIVIPVDGEGRVNPAYLADSLEENALVSVMLANNETGIIQPIREISEITRAKGALLHVDAVQGVGKLPLDMGMLGADMLTLSAHKAGGAVGAAALLVRQGVAVAPLLRGGGQELNRRAGTENLAVIVAFGKLMGAGLDSARLTQQREWLDEMEETLIQAGGVVIGKNVERLANTSLIAMPSVPSETQLMAFDLAGIAVSAGSACSSGRVEPSHVLKAMGLAPEIAASAVRVSIGWNTKPEELEYFTLEWKKLFQRLRADNPPSP